MTFIRAIWGESEKKEINCLVGSLLFRIYALSKIKKLIALFNNMEKHILKIKELIGDSKLKEVFEQLDRIQGLDRTENGTLISLKRNYNDFKTKELRNLHRDGQREQELSVLTNNLLSFTNILEDKTGSLSLFIKKLDLLKLITEGTLNEIFDQLFYLKLENRTKLSASILVEYTSIKADFADLSEHLEISDLSNEDVSKWVSKIKNKLKLFVNSLGDSIFENTLKREDKTKDAFSEPTMKTNREKYLKELYLRILEFFNRKRKNSIHSHIHRDVFLGDKYVTFDELVSKFIDVNGPNIDRADSHLDAPWDDLFMNKHKKFFSLIKKSLSKKYFDCVIFNSLVKAIESDETLVGIEDEQKILGTLIIISGLVSYVEDQYPENNGKARSEFVSMSNRIIARVFENPNLTLADFKHIMADRKPKHPKIREAKELELLNKTINRKLGIFINIIKNIYKIFDDPFISKKSKEKMDVSDLNCLVNEGNGGFFRPKSNRFFSSRFKKSEDRFLLDFHIFVLNIKGYILKLDKSDNSKPKIDFLIEASHNNQFKYRKTSLLIGLSQFWLLPVKEPFLGKWPH